ncbi:prepilin-type N-terminal cleavage/methylation domain-containing protein [Actinoplanes lobatus]|uniref:Prepilin-type N-terminal cleavage/methylation domain-containing protein n=1 Tax=Actinoplanes lobatus TaxID=113568 RepID=A0A7W7H963_9ACTN|nr:prepilin-type N-terminal cleavage/methylation domain-containing protein [Actinoplanes lobatus]MBB4746231.1 prepilin-type N-terminal cleavage/methylation domain-containing protein [Actinoplanes lobatus]GGN61214.1 prepilin-type N-terminal cleavage/methylation domain-containing protein [Actinoplanes lobatus]GIE41439.1 prepilin-type N-terminal cleavage/methylation domain-containing protein [Actinoplanes lobatus]
MRLTPRTARDDAGFTLIELLIVVAITAVIVVPLGNALILYFRNTDATAARMSLSHDAQISAAYLARDVAAVGLRDLDTAGPGGTIPFKASIQVNAAFDAGGQVCGTSATPAAKIRLLADDWDASTSPATRDTRIVAYYLAPAGTVSELHRLVCADGATTDIVVAHHVDPATFTVSCASPTTCESASVPQTVTLAFSATLPGADPYPITLTGHRRQQ